MCLCACLTKGCCASLTFTSLVHFKSSTQQKLTFSFLNLSLCTATLPDTKHWRLIHFCRSLSVPIACPLWLSWNAKQWQRYYGNTAFVLITALSDGNESLRFSQLSCVWLAFTGRINREIHTLVGINMSDLAYGVHVNEPSPVFHLR